MKTETTFRFSGIPLELIKTTKASKYMPAPKVIHRSDLKNHHFARIENKSIEDASNWDASWFSNYE